MRCHHAIAILIALVVPAGCGDTRRVDLFLDRQSCAAGCNVDRFDLYIARGCLYAWRFGLTGAELVLEQLELETGAEVTVQVEGRCGNDSCVRCAAQGTVKLGSTKDIDLALKPVVACAATHVTAPCGRCLPGPDAYCDGTHRVSCLASGNAERQACPESCTDGVCTPGCTTIFYRDVDGDTFGDSTAQKAACARPAGYAERGGDCDDGDPAAYPGQPAFFVQPSKTKKTYDYNCDQVDEMEYSKTYNCRMEGGACVGSGWLVLVPGCGQIMAFVACTDQGGVCAANVPLPGSQPCR